MKAKFFSIIGALIFLSGCHALDHKCNYIPQNCCGRPDKSYTYCEGCRHPESCIGDTCSACWRCRNHFNDT